jgi:hypothetical protein
MAFRPAQVHAQDHLGPVLCLGAAGARLDIDIGVIGVHLAREHAPEFEPGQPLLETAEIRLDFGYRIGIVFLDCEFQQFAGIVEAGAQFVEDNDNLFELRTLLAERLGAIGFIPYIGLFELALDLGQAFRLAVVVKDTSSTQRCVQQDPLSTV